MRSSLRTQSVRVDEENPYWISFSDLMSALLVVFILAAVALIIELTETQKKIENDIQQLQNAEQARKDIIYEIKNELAKQNITVIVADNDTVLRIPETTLTFKSNSYEIPEDEQLRKALEQIGFILHNTINKPFDDSKNGLMRFEYLDTVFLEGHTDSQASRRVKGNWGLSSYRAISLWEFWEERLAVSPTFSEMENAFGQKLFSVSGYAASRRVQLTEETPEQRTVNRRIDIRFTVKRPTISQLEEIVDK
ncbi:MAG: flagellar motor protein MotB [Desulforhopalus sp.]|jgi:flagellar motor protein MotB